MASKLYSKRWIAASRSILLGAGMAGLQCHKRLWWTVHEPTAPELRPDEALRAVFDEGTRVGEVARTYVPGGVLIDLPYNAYDERIRATKAALQQRTRVIYEASFREWAGRALAH